MKKRTAFSARGFANALRVSVRFASPKEKEKEKTRSYTFALRVSKRRKKKKKIGNFVAGREHRFFVHSDRAEGFESVKF